MSEAQDSVKSEIQKLNTGTDKAVEKINQTINEILVLIESRKQEMLDAVAEAAQEKKKVLEEQLTIIEGEKTKVRFLYFFKFIKTNYFLFFFKKSKFD